MFTFSRVHRKLLGLLQFCKETHDQSTGKLKYMCTGIFLNHTWDLKLASNHQVINFISHSLYTYLTLEMELKNTHNYRMWLLTVAEANNPSPQSAAALRTAAKPTMISWQANSCQARRNTSVKQRGPTGPQAFGTGQAAPPKYKCHEILVAIKARNLVTHCSSDVRSLRFINGKIN